MSKHSPDPAVTCTLTDEERKDRSAPALTILTRSYQDREELENGYTFTFAGVSNTLPALSTFISNERECCSFADYTITISPPYDEAQLTVTGPDGTKALFAGFIEEVASLASEIGEFPSLEDRSNQPTGQRKHVRDEYASVAKQSSSSDESAKSTCCGDAESVEKGIKDRSRLMGYSDEELSRVEPGANLGLGCGNPAAFARISPGDVVVDLGSGAGFDCFLAAQEVGEAGKVIGVDMTPEMIDRARANIEENDASIVEFRLGEIEHLPIADESVDMIISNCVVNLSPDKQQVFDEAFRVLRPGGGLAISDIVVTAEPPEIVETDDPSLTSCISGASSVSELESLLRESGFDEISIQPNDESKQLLREWDASRDLSDYLISASIQATKPHRHNMAG